MTPVATTPHRAGDNSVGDRPCRGRAVIATIETGRGARGVVVCETGSRAFVTNLYDDTPREIDVATQTVRRHIRVGRTPNGVTWAPI